jgi:hypothetical protein
MIHEVHLYSSTIYININFRLYIDIEFYNGKSRFHPKYTKYDSNTNKLWCV